MPKQLKEWHLRRENGVWRVYRRILSKVWGFDVRWYKEECVASAAELPAAIALGKHHYNDLIRMSMDTAYRATHI